MKKEKKKDKFYRRKLKQGILWGIIFTSMSILLFGAMLYTTKKDLDFAKTAKITKGEIIDIDYWNSKDNVIKMKYEPIGDKKVNYIVIEYVVDNVTYSGISKYIDSHMYIGKSVNIYYNETNPEEFIVKNSLGFFIILPIVCFPVGIGRIAIEIKKIIRYIETLNGVEIKADIVRVIETHKPWGNRYKIECTGKDEAGDTYTFYSRNFEEANLEQVIEKMKLNTVKVRYKKYQPKKYIVLTESLERRLSV